MPKSIDANLLTTVQETISDVTAKAEGLTGFLGSIRAMIVQQFGENGLIAAYIALAALVVLLMSRLTKITFSTLKYLVVPAVALAFLGSYFLPFSFVGLLPITVAFCSVILLFKG